MADKMKLNGFLNQHVVLYITSFVIYVAAYAYQKLDNSFLKFIKVPETWFFEDVQEKFKEKSSRRLDLGLVF